MIIAIEFLHPGSLSIVMRPTEFRYYGFSPYDFVSRALRFCTVGVEYRIRVQLFTIGRYTSSGTTCTDFLFVGVSDNEVIDRMTAHIIKECSGE